MKFLIQNDCNSLTSCSIAGCRPNEIRNRSSSARALSSTERSIRSVFGTSSYHLNMLTVITQKEATCVKMFPNSLPQLLQIWRESWGQTVISFKMNLHSSCLASEWRKIVRNLEKNQGHHIFGLFLDCIDFCLLLISKFYPWGLRWKVVVFHALNNLRDSTLWFKSIRMFGMHRCWFLIKSQIIKFYASYLNMNIHIHIWQWNWFLSAFYFLNCIV